MTAKDATSAGDELSSRIADLAVPRAEAAGIELVDVEVKGQRGSRMVRLIADAPGGLDIDRIAELSREVGDIIDGVVPGGYTLEVTSPGTDRPLRSARDFARNTGRDVRVQRTQAAAKDAPGEVTGKVVEVTDDSVALNVKGKRVAIALEDIDHGKVVLPW